MFGGCMIFLNCYITFFATGFTSHGQHQMYYSVVVSYVSVLSSRKDAKKYSTNIAKISGKNYSPTFL
jgi:hypothetical protein